MLNEKGGITEGEIAESALAEYEHGADAADDVALEVQEGIWEMVLFALQPSTVWEVRWRAAGFPTLASPRCCAEIH